MYLSWQETNAQCYCTRMLGTVMSFQIAEQLCDHGQKSVIFVQHLMQSVVLSIFDPLLALQLRAQGF